jgi:Ca2+-binding EF-hand superfamily protein
MIREKVTPSMTFKAADTNKNNLITPQELKEAIKLLIPEDTLSFLDIKQIMMAFDIDRNGTIDEKEFLTLFEKVQKLAPSILG